MIHSQVRGHVKSEPVVPNTVEEHSHMERLGSHLMYVPVPVHPTSPNWPIEVAEHLFSLQSLTIQA